MIDLTEQARRVARERTRHLACDVGTRLGAILESTGLESATLARVLGCGPTRVRNFLAGHDAAPLLLLAHEGVAIGVALRLATELLALRAPVVGCPSCEVATSTLTAACGELLAVAGRALASGSIRPAAHDELRRLVAALHERCSRWLRDYDTLPVLEQAVAA